MLCRDDTHLAFDPFGLQVGLPELFMLPQSVVSLLLPFPSQLLERALPYDLVPFYHPFRFD